MKPELCRWVEDATNAPPRQCGRSLKRGRSGYCTKHERVYRQLLEGEQKKPLARLLSGAFGDKPDQVRDLRPPSGGWLL